MIIRLHCFKISFNTYISVNHSTSLLIQVVLSSSRLWIGNRWALSSSIQDLSSIIRLMVLMLLATLKVVNSLTATQSAPAKRAAKAKMSLLQQHFHGEDVMSDRYGGTSTKLMSIYHATEYSTNSNQPTIATPVSCMHSNNPVSSHLKRSTLSMTPSIREHFRVILLSRSVSCMIVRLRWRKWSTTLMGDPSISKQLITVRSLQQDISISFSEILTTCLTNQFQLRSTTSLTWLAFVHLLE